MKGGLRGSERECFLGQKVLWGNLFGRLSLKLVY